MFCNFVVRHLPKETAKQDKTVKRGMKIKVSTAVLKATSQSITDLPGLTSLTSYRHIGHRFSFPHTSFHI